MTTTNQGICRKDSHFLSNSNNAVFDKFSSTCLIIVFGLLASGMTCISSLNMFLKLVIHATLWIIMVKHPLLEVCKKNFTK